MVTQALALWALREDVTGSIPGGTNLETNGTKPK